MSAGPDPQANLEMIEQTRKQINRLFEEVARMSEQDLPPAEYYGEFLKRVLAALAAPAGAVWVRTPQGNLQLQFQINMQQVGVNRNEPSRQGHDELLRQAVLKGQPIQMGPHSSAGTPEGNNPAPGNPTDYLLLLVPILVDKQVAGLLEVWQMPDRHPTAIPGFLTFMTHMAELAARYSRHQMMGQLVKQQQLWGQLETFARQVHGSLNPVEVAYLVANEGRRLIDCDRVSVAVRHGKKTVVEAVSGADVVEKRSNLVQLMKALFEAVLNWGEKLVYSGSKDDSLPPNVLTALDAYLAESNSKLLVVLPLRDEREGESSGKPPRSALMMECFEPAAAPEQLTARLEVVGRHSTAALYNAVEHRRIPFRFLWMPIAKVQEGLGGKARAITYSILTALLLLLLMFVFVPYPLKMEATGQLVPETRVWVYPPVEGRVTAWEVSPNQEVGEDFNLAIMYDPRLAKELPDLDEEIKGQELLAKTNQTWADKDSIPDPERAKFKLDRFNAEIKRRQKEAERAALIERYKAIPEKAGAIKLVSPKFPPSSPDNPLPPDRRWTVLSRDFRENLTDRYVKPSDQLLRLGDVGGEWEIELKIPQKHIGQVLKAYGYEKTNELDVDLLLKSAPTRVFKGKLARDKVAAEAVANQTDNNESEPVVIASVRIRGKDIAKEDQVPRELLVTGTEVHAKVRCGNHRMGYSLFYGVWEFFYEKVVFFF